MRFEVPQFIEVEDKIVGPLTWKQFVYLAGGVGLLVLLYFSPLPKIFFVFLGLPLAGLSVSLAFHKVNNRPFSIFLESFLSYFTKKKLYLWKRDSVQTITQTSPERMRNAGSPSSLEADISSVSQREER